MGSFWFEAWGQMGLMEKRKRAGRRDKIPAFSAFVMSVVGLAWIAAPLPAFAVELSAPIAALYTMVSIFPPSATSMTVCYGFVCRRRQTIRQTG